MLTALFFVSAPVFWLGLMALWLFWYKLGISPGTGYVPIGTSFGSWFSHMIMPWVVLALLYAAFYARMTRGNLIETMGQDYIRTARAKGLPERVVVVRHGFRNTLIPLATIVPIDVITLIGGAVITEAVFARPGMGQLFVQSLGEAMIEPVMAYLLITASLAIIANIVADIVYAVVDPRIRLDA